MTFHNPDPKPCSYSTGTTTDLVLELLGPGLLRLLLVNELHEHALVLGAEQHKLKAHG